MVELEFAQALEAPNKQFTYNFSLPLEIDENVLLPHKFIGDAIVSLIYFVDFDSVLHLNGNIRVPCKFYCDRCGGCFEKNLYLDIDECLYPDMDDPEELSYDMPKIQLDDIISSYVLVNFPSKVLCKEDCLGLCGSCGADLNHFECDCSKVKVGKNNPFLDLFNKQ